MAVAVPSLSRANRLTAEQAADPVDHGAGENNQRRPAHMRARLAGSLGVDLRLLAGLRRHTLTDPSTSIPITRPAASKSESVMPGATSELSTVVPLCPK